MSSQTYSTPSAPKHDILSDYTAACVLFANASTSPSANPSWEDAMKDKGLSKRCRNRRRNRKCFASACDVAQARYRLNNTSQPSEAFTESIGYTRSLCRFVKALSLLKDLEVNLNSRIPSSVAVEEDTHQERFFRGSQASNARRRLKDLISVLEAATARRVDSSDLVSDVVRPSSALVDGDHAELEHLQAYSINLHSQLMEWHKAAPRAFENCGPLHCSTCESLGNLASRGNSIDKQLRVAMEGMSTLARQVEAGTRWWLEELDRQGLLEWPPAPNPSHRLKTAGHDTSSYKPLRKLRPVTPK